MRAFKDSDMSIKARQFRYSEFMGLNEIPFMSAQQSRRWNRLKTLRRRDNLYAFNQDKAVRV